MKKAFTLAEVLITLGIIGVVAAMTLPSLINKTRNKELHTAYMKTYSELNQIAMRFKVDNEISVTEFSTFVPIAMTAKEFNKYYAGSTTLSSTGQGKDDGTGNYQALYDLSYLNGKKFAGGNNAGGKNSSFLCDDTGIYANSRGAIYIFNNRPATDGVNGPVICVDINGKKGPNRYGVDYFLFIFTIDGGVIPMGQEHKDNVNYVCNSGSGDCNNFSNEGSQYCAISANNYTKNVSCAYYALINEHPTVKGRDYWNDFLGEVYRR